MRSLEDDLRASRAAGRKLLVPYITGGVDGWEDAIRAAALAGADAVEIGIPFSDPMIDGPVIQAASQRALEAGATPAGIVDAIGRLDAGIPLAVMTYYNLVFRAGHQRFAQSLIAAGVAAAIVLLRLLIKDDGDVPGAEDFIERGLGLFLAFIAAAAVLAGAFM